MILGLDMETTDLDIHQLYVLEISCVLYTDDLDEVDTFSRVLSCPDQGLARMNDYVTEMHTSSGLLDEVADSTHSLEVFQDLLEWMSPYDLRKAPLFGNSVHFDRAILRRFCPEALEHISHRNIDVSTIFELNKRWGSQSLVKDMSHRALDDIRTSAKLARNYRKILWSVPKQGWIQRIWSRITKLS